MPLSDQSALAKQKRQIAELQERREQLEMMMEWKQGLSDLTSETISQLAQFWSEHSHGWSLNEHGKLSLRKWLGQFTASEIITAMEAALTSYLELDKNDPSKATSASVEKAFASIPGICRVNRASKDDPDVRQLYYIRGIIRKRMAEIGNYFNDRLALDDLKAARSWDVPLEDLRRIAIDARNWTQFRAMISEAIEERGGDPGLS